LEQFEISDDRSVSEVSEFLNYAGYDVVWKDWDSSYDKPNNIDYETDFSKDQSSDRNLTLVS